MKVRNNQIIKIPKQRIKKHTTIILILVIWLLIFLINGTTLGYIKVIIYICLIFSPFLLGGVFILFSFFYKEIKKYFDYSFFQKVRHINMGLHYLGNNNFLNHHNYYKNYELEHKYFHYLKVSEIKKMSPFFFIFIIGISVILFFLNMFLVIFYIPIFVVFIVMLILYGEQKPEDIKEVIKQKIYFKRMKPTAFQKIEDKIFFY